MIKKRQAEILAAEEGRRREFDAGQVAMPPARVLSPARAHILIKEVESPCRHVEGNCSKAVSAGGSTLSGLLPDMQGRLVGKRFQAEYFLGGAHAETHGCDYLLANDIDMEPVPGLCRRPIGKRAMATSS